jgi:hypothetical protein
LRPWAAILPLESVDVQLRNLLIYSQIAGRTAKTFGVVATAAIGAIVLVARTIAVIRLRMDVSPHRRAERVRQILSTRGLTLYQVSRKSSEIFGRSSPSYIPHNLYYDVSVASLSPSIHQVLALSRITNYRVSDWLAVFGFDLDAIPWLQSILPKKRTVILDSTVYDTDTWIPWFAEKLGSEIKAAIVPLGQLLIPHAPVTAKELLALEESRFLYAKVGQEDSLAFPEIGPGSIIRIDAERSREVPSPAKNFSDKRIFVVEHEFGFACSRLCSLGKGRITLRSPQLPFSLGALTLDKELRILGVVDAEIRSLPRRGGPPVTFAASTVPTGQRLPEMDSQMNLKQLIRRSRIRAGLSFRDASQLTRSIAQRLADPLYFTAPSTLSDYETLTAPPRHVQKIVTLCVLYSIGFWDFLRACGDSLEGTGGEPIPATLLPRELPHARRESNVAIREGLRQTQQNGFLGTLLKRWREVPLFLRKSLSDLTRVPNLSISEFFWVGGDPNPIHPWLENAELVVVNRRVRQPVPWSGTAFWEQPLYLLLARDGRYVCGCCTLERGFVVVHPYPDRPFSPRRFKNGTDAEVMGEVTAILRSVN